MSDEYAERKVEAITALYEELCEVFDGRGAVVQRGALAEALATWLAGHAAQDAEAFREELLQNFIQTVRELIPLHAQQLGLPE
jgi:hypothetical protein